MFYRSLLTSVAFILTLSLHANAHAGVTPALGVSGTFTRNDVQRPSTAAECGSINVANNIDTSTAVTVGADDTFSVTVTNFNAGADGSRSVSMKIDATGVGKTFVAGTVQTNGDANPTNVGSQKVIAALPAGTTCSGGKSKDLCLVSFTTTSGFGNCVVVQQSGSGAAAATPAGANSATSTTETSTSTTPVAATPAAKAHDCGENSGAAPVAVATPTPTATTPPAPAKDASSGHDDASSGSVKKPCHDKHKKHTKASAAGTRAARAARADEAASMQ